MSDILEKLSLYSLNKKQIDELKLTGKIYTDMNNIGNKGKNKVIISDIFDLIIKMEELRGRRIGKVQAIKKTGLKINSRDDAYKYAVKVIKRIAITILCCVPVMIIFGYLTRNVITSNALQILCFMLIMGIAVAVVELVVRAKEKTKAEEVETKRDVFR